MRKLLFIIFAILFLPAVALPGGVDTVENPASIDTVTAPDEMDTVTGLAAAGGDCPAWGTYGQSDGQILFAWDGKHPSGQTYACLSDESAIAASSNNGTLTTEGSDVVLTVDADNERMEWSITSSNIETERTGGMTMWVEVRINSAGAGNTSFAGIDGNNSNFWEGAINSSAAATSWWYGDGTGQQSGSGALSVDNSTWNKAGFAVYPAETNDNAANDNVGWDEDADSLASWTASEANVYIGNDHLTFTSTDVDIRKFVVIGGYKQPCPF